MATINHRLLPPTGTGRQTITANGRTYVCQVGGAIDVPSFDAAVLEANGWIFVAMSGTTAARPAPSLSPIGAEGVQAGPGARFYDTTLADTIYCDGATWRNGAGASV